MLKLISLLLLLNSSASFANEEENFVCSAFYVKPLVTKVNAPNAELLDMMGMGNPETADIRANVVGIAFAKKKEATNDEECMDLCGILYP